MKGSRAAAAAIAAATVVVTFAPAPAAAVVGRGYGVKFERVACSGVDYRIAVPANGRPTMFWIGYDNYYVLPVYLRRGESLASGVDFQASPGRHVVQIGIVQRDGTVREVSRWTPTSCRAWKGSTR